MRVFLPVISAVFSALYLPSSAPIHQFIFLSFGRYYGRSSLLFSLNGHIRNNVDFQRSEKEVRRRPAEVKRVQFHWCVSPTRWSEGGYLQRGARFSHKAMICWVSLEYCILVQVWSTWGTISPPHFRGECCTFCFTFIILQFFTYKKHGKLINKLCFVLNLLPNSLHKYSWNH